MKVLNIKGRTGSSEISIGQKIGNLREYLSSDRVVIITDTNVLNYYKKDFPPYPIIEIGLGEKIKTLPTLEHIFEKLIEYEADRSYFIVGIGGGIVCDITGLAASTYMRGVGFGFVSSTLLAQVDASVGGKTGINFYGYKNMIGVFNQPDFVICDMEMLKTLPRQEIICGMAEIVKHGAIADASLFSFLEENSKGAISLDSHIIERLVFDSVVIKSDVVNRDEKEKGERKKLNFGHTLGHALQKISELRHGEAVSIGMLAASIISERRGYLSSDDVARMKALLEDLELPTSLDCDPQKIFEALKKDKKRKGDVIEFILLKEIGNAIIESISINELEETVKALGLFKDKR